MTYAIQEYLLTSCSPTYQHLYPYGYQHVTTDDLTKYFICSTICFTLLIHISKISAQIVPEIEKRPNTQKRIFGLFDETNVLKHVVDSGKFHVKSIGHISVHYFTVGNIESFLELRILIKCFFPTLVGDIYGIRQRHIGETQR